PHPTTNLSRVREHHAKLVLVILAFILDAVLGLEHLPACGGLDERHVFLTACGVWPLEQKVDALPVVHAAHPHGDLPAGEIGAFCGMNRHGLGLLPYGITRVTVNHWSLAHPHDFQWLDRCPIDGVHHRSHRDGDTEREATRADIGHPRRHYFEELAEASKPKLGSNVESDVGHHRPRDPPMDGGHELPR